MAFLLYDEVDYILQALIIAERARLAGSLSQGDFLSAWIRRQRDGLWENKILEALCIIQNFKAVQKLGCNVENEKTRFLPNTPESSLFVNCLRKCLYHVCESLDAEALKVLLKNVIQDFSHFRKEQKLETFDPQYMEMNILYWASHGYIR
jgi:hypothetical protein